MPPRATRARRLASSVWPARFDAAVADLRILWKQVGQATCPAAQAEDQAHWKL